MKSSLILLALVLSTGAQLMGAGTETWSGSADITFSGSSTLHDWAGKVSAKPFSTVISINDAGNPTRVQATITVESAKMDTAEPKRDENMRKAMKAADHPLISATIDVPADKIATDLKTPTRLPMTLDLLGRSQQVTGLISNYKREGGKVSFDLDFPVSMKASGISVPSVLLFIRVGDAVQVHASVTLKQS